MKRWRVLLILMASVIASLGVDWLAYRWSPIWVRTVVGGETYALAGRGVSGVIEIGEPGVAQIESGFPFRSLVWPELSVSPTTLEWALHGRAWVPDGWRPLRTLGNVFVMSLIVLAVWSAVRAIRSGRVPPDRVAVRAGVAAAAVVGVAWVSSVIDSGLHDLDEDLLVESRFERSLPTAVAGWGRPDAQARSPRVFATMKVAWFDLPAFQGTGIVYEDAYGLPFRSLRNLQAQRQVGATITSVEVDMLSRGIQLGRDRSLPLRPIPGGAILNFVVYFLVLHVALRGTSLAAAWNRRRRGLCGACGYPVADGCSLCPECGERLAHG